MTAQVTLAGKVYLVARDSHGCNLSPFNIFQLPLTHWTTLVTRGGLEVVCTASNTTHRPTDPPTQRPSDPATQRPSDPATERPNDPAAQRPSGPTTQRPSDPATQRPNDPAAQRPSDPAVSTPTRTN
uniref:Axon-associated SH3 binding-like protein 126 n=1 Tax=Procambarus clarkii TaxID=6728 RepID=Q9XYC5_PROCL|nr:axon-associated SH3 binding-like protein 126 [Procambarus clarkii]